MTGQSVTQTLHVKKERESMCGSSYHIVCEYVCVTECHIV